MGKITVVNKYKEPNHIYCGRGTPLGNPFVMHNESERNYVCDAYEDWFADIVHSPNRTSPALLMLRKVFQEALKGDINLGCFCAPKRCHCDTIKSFIQGKLLIVGR